MGNRSAVNTILGYYYQFDYSIYKLLEIENEDFITIEGIEDIDIHTANEETAIQCKYYHSTEYSHSKIAQPIRLMLKHYKDVKDGRKNKMNYYLYGFYKYGTEKLNLPITVDFLKEKFLTFTHDKIKHKYYEELQLDDYDLKDFIKKLTININALEYTQQVESIVEMLQLEFECTKFEAENYYYNNALKVIKNLATKPNIVDRRITRVQFLKLIDNKELLFNEWYVQLKGKKELLKEIRKEYFTQLNLSPFERFFLIEVNSIEYNRSELKEIIMIISRKWTKISNREPNPFCPYVYIHNLKQQELIELKKELRNEQVKFIDGISFEGADFSIEEMKQTANYNNQIKIKIINKLDYIDLLTSNIRNKTKEIYQFYIKDLFYKNEDPSIKKVNIQIENFRDIKEVI